MTTTPEPTKGVPRLEGNPAPTLRADHNDLADWVRDNVDGNVATVGDLPTQGNWVGRRIYVVAKDFVYVWKGSAVGWAKPGPFSQVMSWGTTAGGSGSYKDAGDVLPLFRMGQAGGTTNSGGRLNWTFPVPFPNGISTVILTPHQNSNGTPSSMPTLIEDSVTRTGFSTIWGGKASTTVFMPYVAIGY
ncbi:hypothetical protein HUN59_05120 [Curtobacterium sp. Csp2]|uniref:gp53-like domain-containing protein n=1 Tax=Curtobacterium sp. Csp2 TaxID=2495430 RepID=UPI0015801028|nr:hypothetical protein [Curtobacterium sp. Csp2]QKS15678.1 hypothetical protein HUN59_05120 [Curtobacterium sp. Csp2]